MSMRCLFSLLLAVCWLLSSPPTWATGEGRPAIHAAAPDSALVHLTAAQVAAPAMQRLDNTVRWPSPTTSDHSWLLTDPDFLVGQEPPGWRGLGCFRLRFTLDSALLGQPLGLSMLQQGASEVFLDGQRLGGFGTVGVLAATTRGFEPRYLMLPFMLRTAGPHLLAVRYARYGAWPLPYGGFALRVAPAVRLQAE